MASLLAKIREERGRKVKGLRKKGMVPAVLYGPKIKNLSLEISQKDFEKVYGEIGRSSLVSIEIAGKKEKYLALVREVSKNPVSEEVIHVDFYQPDLTKKVGARVPIVISGEAPAVRELAGTLIQNIFDVEVRALPQSLPKEIIVDVSGLKTFEDSIFIKDLKVSEGVEILKGKQETVASVAPALKVEEELAKPIEEKVEEVEKVGEKEKAAAAEAMAAKEEKEETKQEAKKEKPK